MTVVTPPQTAAVELVEGERHTVEDHRRRGARGKVFFVSQTRLSKVHVTVKNAGKDMSALGVDFFFAFGQLVISAERNDSLVADSDATLKSFAGRDHPTVFYN